MNRPIKKSGDTKTQYVMHELALDDLEKVAGGAGGENEIKERFSFKPLKTVIISCIHVIKRASGVYGAEKISHITSDANQLRTKFTCFR